MTSMKMGFLAWVVLLGCGHEISAQEEKGSIDRELLQLIRELRGEVNALRQEVRDLKEHFENSGVRGSTDSGPSRIARQGGPEKRGTNLDRATISREQQERMRRTVERNGSDRERTSDREREDLRRDESNNRDSNVRRESTRDRSATPSRGRPREQSEAVRKDREKPRAITPEGKRSTRESDAKKSSENRRTERIFVAYDKNKDNKVSFDEWLKMKEGKMTDERVSREKQLFNDADKDKDDSITWKEFLVMTTKRTTQRED